MSTATAELGVATRRRDRHLSTSLPVEQMEGTAASPATEDARVYGKHAEFVLRAGQSTECGEFRIELVYSSVQMGFLKINGREPIRAWRQVSPDPNAPAAPIVSQRLRMLEKLPDPEPVLRTVELVVPGIVKFTISEILVDEVQKVLVPDPKAKFGTEPKMIEVQKTVKIPSLKFVPTRL